MLGQSRSDQPPPLLRLRGRGAVCSASFSLQRSAPASFAAAQQCRMRMPPSSSIQQRSSTSSAGGGAAQRPRHTLEGRGGTQTDTESAAHRERLCHAPAQAINAAVAPEVESEAASVAEVLAAIAGLGAVGIVAWSLATLRDTGGSRSAFDCSEAQRVDSHHNESEERRKENPKRDVRHARCGLVPGHPEGHRWAAATARQQRTHKLTGKGIQRSK